MDDYNVIQVLDKIKKNIDRNAIPLAVGEIETTMIMLERKISLTKGKRFADIHIEQDMVSASIKGDRPLSPEQEMRYKINEIIRFLNERFPLH